MSKIGKAKILISYPQLFAVSLKKLVITELFLLGSVHTRFITIKNNPLKRIPFLV